jgi:dipeptidyl aminopeptidase/acylaminoacyl peptidase
MRTVLGVLACIAGIAVSHAAEPVKPAPASTTPAPAAAKPAQPQASVVNYELTLVDMQGQKKVLATLPDSVFAPRVSPDGRRVAFELLDTPVPGEPQLTRIQVASIDNLDKRRALQPTVTARRHVAPVWSPDGDWIAFVATGNAADALFRERSDGWIQPKYLVDGRAVEGLYEGGFQEAGLMLFITRKDEKDYGISMLDLGTMQVTRLVDLPGSAQHSSRLSPDGKWLAYASDETGRQEVWLEPFPTTGKRYQLTKDGGAHPQWSPDGGKLYFDTGGRLYSTTVTTSGEPRAADPVALPIQGFQQGAARRQYDLMPDGKAFLMLFPVQAP